MGSSQGTEAQHARAATTRKHRSARDVDVYGHGRREQFRGVVSLDGVSAERYRVVPVPLAQPREPCSAIRVRRAVFQRGSMQ